MTREDAIKMWHEIAHAVFVAEERISKEWDERLKAAPSMTKEEQHQFAEEYCEAIAKEIVKNTSDEQLKEM